MRGKSPLHKRGEEKRENQENEKTQERRFDRPSPEKRNNCKDKTKNLEKSRG